MPQNVAASWFNRWQVKQPLRPHTPQPNCVSFVVGIFESRLPQATATATVFHPKLCLSHRLKCAA